MPRPGETSESFIAKSQLSASRHSAQSPPAAIWGAPPCDDDMALKAEQPELMDPIDRSSVTRSSTDQSSQPASCTNHSSNSNPAGLNDIIFKGPSILSKGLLVHRHKVSPVSRISPARASRNLRKNSSDEEMESIIAGLRRIGPPGKALTTSDFPRDSNNVPDPNRHALRPCGSRSLIPPSSLYRSSPKLLHRHKCLKQPLAKEISNTSSGRNVTPPKHLCVDSACDQRYGSWRKSTPAQSLSQPDVYDSDDEMKLTMVNLGRVAPPAKKFHSSEPHNDLSSTFASSSECSSSFDLNFSNPTGDNDHARKTEQSKDTAPNVNRLVEEAMDKRSSFGSILGDDEDWVDDFIMPIWPAMTSISDSLSIKNSSANGLSRTDECLISTRLFEQQVKNE